MEGLIIAAGQGLRLREKGDSKPLTLLQEVPLIEQVISRAIVGGIDRFTVITGYEHTRLSSFLKDLSRRTQIPIIPLFNESWDGENGLSVLKAKEHLKEPFVLLMSDHLFDPQIIRTLLQYVKRADSTDSVTLCVDANLENPLVDLDDVTKVLTKGGKILDIGKGIKPFNCFDTGIFHCTPDLYEALEKSINLHKDASLSGAMRVVGQTGKAGSLDVTGHFWIDIDDARMFEKAVQELAKLQNR